MALSKAEQDKRKDVGGFVGGSLRDGLRRRGCCTGRSLITLDMDCCAPGSTQQWVAAIKALGTAAVYSTRKHDPEHPRLRAIFPTDRVMQPEEYQPCARMVAQMLDPTMQVFDKTTFEAERLMYWRSRSRDSLWVCEGTEDCVRISVDDTLWLYEDWHDVRQWPACSAETVKLPGGKQADPTAKQGVVGAFCRTYDVPAAIEKFLPGVYVDAGAGRLTYAAGSTTAGAVLYDKGNFIYSHHSTDPAGGKLLNAWDLVRIHLFGQLDADAAPGTPAASLPSWQQMRALAENDGPTAALLRQETVDHAMEGFEPLPEMVRVPLVGSIACGIPITAEQNIECYIGVPAAWHADFALTCHGSSMAPTICDGDIVCIRRQPEGEQGEIAAVRIGEEATLKHFHRQGETVMLLADNTAVCPPMVFAGPQLEEIQIEGRAVGFCRGL